MDKVTREIIAEYKSDPQKVIEQIEWCNYECEAGTVKSNVAWIAIKELLARQVLDGEIVLSEDEVVRRYAMFIALAISIPKAINIKPFDEVFKQAAKYSALRQYRKPEPCEWCDPMQTLFASSTLDEGHVRDTDEPNYCSNCGRPLGGDRT